MRSLLAVCAMAMLGINIGCGTTSHRTSLRPGTEFKLESSVTVVSSGYDSIGATGMFEAALSNGGFNVIAQEVAESIAKLSVEIGRDKKGNASGFSAEYGRYRNFRSVYALKFSYATRADTGYGNVFSSLTYQIFDLKEGRIVATGSYRTGSLSTIAPQESVDMLVDELISKGVR